MALFSWIDYSLFSIMISFGCFVGIYFGFYKKQDTVLKYIHGNKNMKWFPVSMSLTSSVLTSFFLLGYPTEVYMYGTQISMLVFSIIISGWINYFVFLPVFFKLQVSNIYEYLEVRFNTYLRNTISIAYIITVLFILPVIMYIPSLIFSQVSGVHLHIVTPVMTLMCIFYTVSGGITAVVWADTLQFGVTILTLLIVITLGLISLGGFDTVFDRLRAGDRLEFFNFSLNPTVRTTFWTTIVGYSFTWTGMIPIAPPEVQRFLALSSMENIKKALVTFTVVLASAKCLCFLLGMIIYATYYDCDPKSIGNIKKIDQIVPYFISEVTPKVYGLNGLFVAAFFGASFSAYSTVLNTCASVIYTDFVQVRIKNKHLKEKHALVLKLLTLSIGVLSIAMIYLVEHFGTVFEVFHYIKGITGGATLGIFLLGLMVPQANTKGAVAGGVVSTVLMGVIIIGTEICTWNGIIQQNPKPLYTYGCNSTSITNTTAPLVTLRTVENNQAEPMWLFKITFQYYYLIGTMTTIIIGIIVSWLTRKETEGTVNPDYISPFIYKYSKKLGERRVRLLEEEIKLNHGSDPDE